MSGSLLIPNVGPIRSGDAISSKAVGEQKPQKGDFDKLLKTQLDDVLAPEAAPAQPSTIKFSAHAMERIRDRGIKMDSSEAARLEKAIDTAATKGSKEALVLTKDAAFIVSVQNRTVITAMDRTAMTGNVFTNIDSTVVI